MKIRLTESKLRQIVNESIKKILKENDNILNGITPEQVLEIINNAINVNNVEVVDDHLECTTDFYKQFETKIWRVDFEGELWIGFYGEENTAVHVQVNVDAWLDLADDEDVDYQKQTVVEVNNIGAIEFYDGKTYTPINMGNMLNQVNEIINSDIVNERLVFDVSYIIENIINKRYEEYQGYLDNETTKKIDAHRGK